MKKRYENITLNGESFILDTKEVAHHNYNTYGRYDDITDAYVRPSSYKIAIWHDWEKWFTNNGGYCWIESRNSRRFTIGGYVLDENGTEYKCYITKAYNRCQKVGA